MADSVNVEASSAGTALSAPRHERAVSVS
jgi:hypothetical protein